MPHFSRKKASAEAARPVPVSTPDLFAPGKIPAIPALPVMGIDVAKATLRVCLLRPGALRSEEADFPNTPDGFAALDRWLAGLGAPRTRAGLEATGHYSSAVLHHLHAAGHFVSLFNPRWIKDYARSEGRRNKTDAADARVIARYVQTHISRAWQPRTPAQEALLALSRRRDTARRTLTAEKLRLESSCAAVRHLIKLSIAHYERQLQAIDKAMRDLLAKDPALHRRCILLESIPGIGRVTAATLLAELPELECFERVRDVAAWAGLTPALCESGTSVRGRARMNRQGNGRLRKALYMPAVVLLRSKAAHALSSFRDRLQAAGKPPMVVIGALMRKLFQTACGVLKHGQSFNPSLA
jgi:transposase